MSSIIFFTKSGLRFTKSLTSLSFTNSFMSTPKFAVDRLCILSNNFLYNMLLMVEDVYIIIFFGTILVTFVIFCISKITSWISLSLSSASSEIFELLASGHCAKLIKEWLPIISQTSSQKKGAKGDSNFILISKNSFK
jgi:hypothetical protein